MAKEVFLINPVRSIKKAKKKRRLITKTSRKNPIGAGVLMLGNAWYDDARGHKRAAGLGWKRRKRKTTKRRKKRRVLSAAPKRRKVAKRGYKRRKKTVSRALPTYYTGATPFRHNPVRRTRRRKRMYSNPALSVKGLKRTIQDVLPLAVTGGASIVATKITPAMVGVMQPWKVMGVQAAVALGGGVVVGKFVNKQHGLIWTVSGAATVVADLLQKYVLTKVLPGVGAYPLDSYPTDYSMGAYPTDVSNNYGRDPYADVPDNFAY